MVKQFLDSLEQRLASGFWFRRGLAITVLVFTYRLTEWGMKFAAQAIADKQDLMATAALIGAVSAIPIALLTLLFNKYVEGRTD